eukprot:3163032-Pleurochrysis_carterae.AAC.1
MTLENAQHSDSEALEVFWECWCVHVGSVVGAGGREARRRSIQRTSFCHYYRRNWVKNLRFQHAAEMKSRR